MKKIKLKESDLTRIIERVVNEQTPLPTGPRVVQLKPKYYERAKDDLEKELRRNEVNITLRRDGTASFPVQEGRTILVLPNADLSKVIPTP
jgi:hypothetical protein